MQTYIAFILVAASVIYGGYRIFVFFRGCRTENKVCGDCQQPCPLKNIKKGSQKFGKKEKNANFASENKKVP